MRDPSTKPLWETLTLEMKGRVIVTAISVPIFAVGLFTNNKVMAGFPLIVLIYWFVRRMVGETLYFFHITGSNGSLVEHLLSEADQRISWFGAVFAVLAIILMGFAIYVTS